MGPTSEGVTDRVSLRWSGDDGDGIGKLTVTASANGFGGQSGAWFNGAAIIDFALEIQSYPLPVKDIAMSGGFGAKDERPPQEHVGICVRPVGSLGQVGMRIHLSTELWLDTDPHSHHEVTLRLLTTYERLRTFSQDLISLVDGHLSEVEIRGETLS